MHLSSITLALWLIFVLIGFAGLVIVGVVSYRTLAGCLVMAAIVTASLLVGIPSFVPELNSGQTKVIAFATIALLVMVLVSERRRYTRARRQLVPNK